MQVKISRLRQIVREELRRLNENEIEVDRNAVEKALASLNAAVDAITSAEDALEGTYVEHPHSQVRTFGSRLMWLGHEITKIQGDLAKTLTHGVTRGITP